MKTFFISTVAWGEDYIRSLLNVSIPCLLAPGNLPALAEENRVIFRLHTDREGAHTFSDHPICRRLEEFAEVTVDGSLFEQADSAAPGEESLAKFVVWTKAENTALAEAAALKAWFISWQPDSMFADGALRHAVSLITEGVQAVCLGTAIIVDREALLDEVQKYRREGPAPVLNIPPRELASLAYLHRHPGFYDCHVLGAQPFTKWPSFLFVPVPGEGVLIRNFHLSPITFLVDKPAAIEEGDTMDLFFLNRYLGLDADIRVVTDTDHICAVNLAGPKEQRETLPTPDPTVLGHFIKHWTDPLHHKFVRTPSYWHYADVTPEKWQEAIRFSDRFIALMFESGKIMEAFHTNP